MHPPRGDSRTRYLSSPRAIRTNGRIRQLSRYIPPTLRASSSLSIASPPPRRRFLLILFLVLLPLPLSRPLSRPRLCSPCIRSRRKCTPASATRSGFSFHAQWQSPFDADFRLTRFIRSPHYTPFPAPLFLPRPHRRYWRTSRTLEKIITYKFYAGEVDAFERPHVSLHSTLSSPLLFALFFYLFFFRICSRRTQRIVHRIGVISRRETTDFPTDDCLQPRQC